jgi:hypothetical protein
VTEGIERATKLQRQARHDGCVWANASADEPTLAALMKTSAIRPMRAPIWQFGALIRANHRFSPRTLVNA